MLSNAFDLGEHLALRKLEYKVSPKLWERFIIPSGVDISFAHWTTIKYLDDNGAAFNVDIEKVPNNTGGLYLFYTKCSILEGITEFPFYIGRAQYTEGQNLRKRVREYFNQYKREVDRPKITRMFKYWSKDLYLAFLPLSTNTDIKDFEKKLINSLLLPMNDEIPDKEIRDAIKAF